MKDLSTYLTTELDELIMQCIVVTKFAIDTSDAGYRESLLYVIIDRQLSLARALGALTDDDFA